MASYNPLREMIVSEARKHLLSVSDNPTMLVNGKRRGAALLRRIFDEACEKPPAWSPAALRALETPGQWLHVNGSGGTTNSKVAVHWCGIFATFVLRKTGIPVKWRYSVGIVPSGPQSKFVHKARSWISSEGFDRNSFAPGDVCVIPSSNHHFIVVDAPQGPTLRCIAGNGKYQQIEWQNHRRADVVCHYRIAWDPFASRL